MTGPTRRAPAARRQHSHARAALAAAVAIAVLLGACGEELEQEATEQARQDEPASTSRGGEASPDGEGAPAAASEPEPARCPPDLVRCRTAEGVIVFVEKIDSDGDGDAHFVLSSREGITGPGISVIDVRRDLRPDPLPGPGDRISAAGPVYPGSYGQRQIEAVVVNTSYTDSR